MMSHGEKLTRTCFTDNDVRFAVAFDRTPLVSARRRIQLRDDAVRERGRIELRLIARPLKMNSGGVAQLIAVQPPPAQTT